MLPLPLPLPLLMQLLRCTALTREGGCHERLCPLGQQALLGQLRACCLSVLELAIRHQRTALGE